MIGNADFREVLEKLHAGVYVVDCEGKIVFWNDGAERITGYLRQDVIGRFCRDNFLEEFGDDAGPATGMFVPINEAIRSGKPTQAQVSIRHKTGQRIPIDLWVSPIRNEHGTVVGAAETFEECISVTEWDRRQQRLAAYGCLDETSGVLTHSMIHSHLRESLGVYGEHPVPFSVLCIEVDQLEQIRRRDGPGALTALVRLVGQTLENSLRPTDFVGRWKESQFLAILLECGPSEVLPAADRLRRMVGASKFKWWGDFLAITVSVGGTAVRTGDTAENLEHRAETALSDSVKQGGNRTTTRLE